MITELEHIDEPIPAKFMHTVIKNVDDHLKKNLDKLVKIKRVAPVASASLKKKSEKTCRREGGTQKEKHKTVRKKERKTPIQTKRDRKRNKEKERIHN
jgi:hypothetical protein